MLRNDMGTGSSGEQMLGKTEVFRKCCAGKCFKQYTFSSKELFCFNLKCFCTLQKVLILWVLDILGK